MATQTKVLINVISGYRTIPYQKVNIMAGIIPIDLKMNMRNEIKGIKRKRESFTKNEILEKMNDIKNSVRRNVAGQIFLTDG